MGIINSLRRTRIPQKSYGIGGILLIIIFIFLNRDRTKAHKDVATLLNEPVATSLLYFIPSDRQDAFNELHNGIVVNMSMDEAEIMFDLNNNKINYLEQFEPGDLVRIFYERDATPLKVNHIVLINRRGEAGSEQEFLKLECYIEGSLLGLKKDKIKLLFDVRNHLTYVPSAISSGDVVNIFYSAGFLKPFVLRRIVKQRDIKNCDFVYFDYKKENDRIRNCFDKNWIVLGGELWKKISHSGIRFEWEKTEVKQLFDIVTAKVSEDLKINKKEVLRAIDKKDYLKF